MRKKEPKTARIWALSGALLLSSVLLVWLALDTHLGFTRPPARAVEITDYCGQEIEALRFPDYLDVTVAYRYDDNAASGVVVSQSPAAGERRKLPNDAAKCPLRLIVSLGRERILLPELTGMDAREAQMRLRGWGLVVEIVTRHGVADEGRVLSMSPDAGVEVSRGATVTLTVSGGVPIQTVCVPDVVGLSRSGALMRVWMAGLRVEEVIEIPSDAPVGTVVRQSHQANTAVTAGTGVTLYVSKETFNYG